MFVLASSVLRPNLKRVQMEKGRGAWKVKGNISRAWDPRGWVCGNVSRSGGMLCSFLGRRLSLLTCLAEPPLSPQGAIQGQQRQPLLGACWKCSTSGSAYSKIPGESHSKKHWPRLDPHISWSPQPQIRFIQVTWRVLSQVH